MTRDEIFNFYDENWNDYNTVMDMLHNIVDKYEDEINILKNKSSNSSEVDKLKEQLKRCEDGLDEERHKTIPSLNS